MKIPSTKKQLVWNFKKYCRSFYTDDDAVYKFNCPEARLDAACELVANHTVIDLPFDADSVNREQVRGVLEALGYSEIERSKEERKARADRALAELKAMGGKNAN